MIVQQEEEGKGDEEDDEDNQHIQDYQRMNKSQHFEQM